MAKDRHGAGFWKVSISKAQSLTAYHQGYERGQLGGPDNNPYSATSQAQAHRNWQAGYNAGKRARG